MNAWNQPIFIALGLAVGLALSFWLFRRGSAPHGPDFECDVCGRAQRGLTAREWRYCPYCGAARGERTRKRL